MRSRSGNFHRPECGFSLAELMITLLLLSLLATGIGQVMLATGRTYRMHDNLVHMQENGRHALEVLQADLRRAGHLGIATGSGAIEDRTTGGRRNGYLITRDQGQCRDISWVRMLSHTVFGLDDHRSGYDCLPAEDFHRGDILVTRYVAPLFRNGDGETRAEDLVPREMYLVTSGHTAVLTEGRHAAMNAREAGDGFTGALVAHGYFIRGRHVPADAECPAGRTIPALYRIAASNGRLLSREVARGIEQFQVQYGIDADGDGAVDAFSDAMDAGDPRWQQLVAVRIWVLARAGCPETGYDNTRHYRMGNIMLVPGSTDLDGDGVIDGDSDGDGNDDYRRQLLTATVALRNS
jgi:type IV pilus assembly protein PilW